eukprot:TRINITY_DN33589_c0_g1_i1.p1 TRINITY_DN33589_c0_g1~~TRINITY_DN33589_c0_g1_i1.p1  ORF type:complete len:167 (+),score=25.26 TRINITY_DN33589_c0_g1_i1:46-546(+)
MFTISRTLVAVSKHVRLPMTSVVNANVTSPGVREIVQQRFMSSEVNTDANSADDNNLVISDTAVARLKEITNGTGWLRVSVEGGGCSGFQYKLDLEDGGTDLGEDDVVVERDGAKVVVDSESLQYLGGATVHYQVELIRAGFKIMSNPKAEGGCSCGASFNIKLDL